MDNLCKFQAQSYFWQQNKDMQKSYLPQHQSGPQTLPTKSPDQCPWGCSLFKSLAALSRYVISTESNSIWIVLI